MDKKVRILYLSASPDDQDPLRSDTEFHEIFQKLDRRYFDISSHSKIKAGDLASVLSKEKPHIVHFSGHGSPDEIVLHDDFNGSRPVRKSAITALFRNLSKKPRLIFLNACWTTNNVAGLGRFVDFIVAVRNEVYDRVAVDFARNFYSLLASEPIVNAFDLAKTNVGNDHPEYQIAMYELFVREGIENRSIIKAARDQVSKKKPPFENTRTSKNIMKLKKTSVKNSTFFQGNIR